MKPLHFCAALCLVFSLSGFKESALASDVVSPRLKRVVSAVEAWQTSGGREPLAVPQHLSAAVRSLLPEKGQLAPAGADALKDPRISVICRTTDPEMLRMSGATVKTVAGQVVTAEIPLSLLKQLDAMPGMISADVPQRYKPLLDVSRPEILADVAHGAGAPPYPGTTGQGVVVGVIDTGLDTDHPDFLNANGTTRLLNLWDQTDGAGPHPAFPYNYGTEWTAANINAGTSREIDTDGHGTHVTGIAAGNGRAIGSPGDQYQFTGIAPEADIIFVKTTFAADDILDAVKWIQLKAGAKPCVINLSLGSQYGGHDGTADLDVAMAALSGPGRIIVAAAGNESNSGIHAQATIPALTTVDLQFSIPSYTATSGNNGGQGNDLCLLEAFSSNSNFNISVVLPNASTVGPVGTNGTVTQSTSQGEVDIDASSVGSERAVYIDIWDKTATLPPASGLWTVRVQNTQSSPHEMDLWLYYVDLGNAFVTWNNNIDNTELVSSPASSDSVIAVGAYVTKTSWPCVASPNGCGYQSPPPVGEIAPFSSPGPLRDGTTKPEITAPGMGIASSLSKDASGPLFTSIYGKMPGGVRYVSQGTSQSSPHITGVTALILEQRPSAAYTEVAAALEGTARHDAYTGPGFSTDFGYGKVDAAAAVAVFVPVRLLSLTAGWDGGQAVVRWELRETEEGASFRVERGPTQTGPFTAQSQWLTGDLSFSWTDPAPNPGEPWYRVVSLDRAGAQEPLGTVALTPQRMIARLLPNAPNPFQASTKIAFELDRTGKVRLDVLDISGRLVTTLASGVRSAGHNEIDWNGLDGTGHRVAPGIYVYRLTTADRVLARRMVMTS
jgi:subtilisin family serine protease